MVISVIIISGYCFEGSFQRLGDFRFQGQSLKALAESEFPVDGGNRFAGTLLGSLRVPVPANYLQGNEYGLIDQVIEHMEQKTP
jgi:hypothetical protein